MANDFSSNPYFIDTAFSSGEVLLRNHRIRSVVWTNQVTAGDVLLVKDGDGKTIINAKASAANTNEAFSFMDGWFFGIQVPTLASGVLLVYVK